MSISIQTNVASLMAQENLNINSKFQSNTIQQLTSGYRINSAGDDAAGLAVANQFRSNVTELTQGVANGNDAVAQLQIMDGGMSNISQILDRLKTLATQSASGTFTGDRNILNQEFQSDIQEIDRQSQSIGLNTGGTFAKSLSVYLGQGSGSQSLSNAQVGVDLSTSTVDSQSLGLKGMQAVVGSADLGSSSATSVASILANQTNSNNGALTTTQFLLSGPGFSSANGQPLAVSVDLNGVGTIEDLVSNINSAIQSVASGSTAADAALKNAGIVASVHTDANGGKQLAFTSSTTAFQVQAGDQMANALMGNFSSGTTGASLSAMVTGSAYDSSGTMAAGTQLNITLSGAGLASPVNIDRTYAGATSMATVVANLQSDVAGNATLAAAGITVGTSNGQIVFTNSKGAQFQVDVAGDVKNQLGLGAFASTGTGSADYNSITAAAAYNRAGNSGVNQQSTLEISVAGQPSISLGSIALDQGNATAASYTSGSLSPTTITGSNDTISFSVDGHTVTTTLTHDTAAVAGSVTGTGTVTPADYSTTNGQITVKYGNATQQVTLTGNDSTVANLVTDLQTGLNSAFGAGAITASQSGGEIVLTSGVAGAGTDITVSAGTSHDAMAALGLNTVTSVAGAAATQTSLASMASQINQAIATAQSSGSLKGTGAGATASVVGSDIVITNSNAGADHSLTAPAGNFGTTMGGSVTAGQNRDVNSLADAINQAIAGNSTLEGYGFQATVASGGKLQITANAGVNFRVNGGAASATAQVVGTKDLTSGADFSVAPATLNVSIDGTSHSVTLNQNYTDQNQLVNAINAQLPGNYASVVSLNGKNYLSFTSPTSGTGGSVQVLSTGTANAALGLTDTTLHNGANEVDSGFGVSNWSSAGSLAVTAASSSLSVSDAAGTAQTGGLTFVDMSSGTQALTVTAASPSGAMQATTINLAASNGTGSDIDSAVNYINQQLQQTNNATLKSIVAVKQNVNGTEEINFMSPGTNFQVSVGSTSDGTGINGGMAKNASGTITGTGSTIAIDTQDGATAAVAAIAAAVSKLGSAQAVVGKGENQLNYAINLAQSQITNFSAAESQIRDADVAAEAANMTKAQVLQQASIAAMAQANSAPQAVLKLLQG